MAAARLEIRRGNGAAEMSRRIRKHVLYLISFKHAQHLSGGKDAVHK